jgi:hypothetical protein
MEGKRVSDQQWLVLRTQEIIASSANEIKGKDAVKEALRERFAGNFDLLLDFAASVTGVLKKLSAATYNLPEHPTLAMDIPQTIVVNTEDGPLFVDRQHAELGHVRSWVFDGLQHHRTQGYRFNRMAKELALLEDRPDELAWVEVRQELEAGGRDVEAE